MKGTLLLLGFCMTNAGLTARAVAARCPRQESAAQESVSDSAETKPRRAPADRTTVGQNQPRVDKEQAFRSEGSFLFKDQRTVWSSPLRLHFSDAQWLVPIAGLAAASFSTDRSLSHSLSFTPASFGRISDLRNGSLAGLSAASAGMYFWSIHSRDPHQRETGLLSG